MNKNTFAPTPPMGWNSYDYYNTEVNETQVHANAEYMASHLKEFGFRAVSNAEMERRHDKEWGRRKRDRRRERLEKLAATPWAAAAAEGPTALPAAANAPKSSARR